MKNNTKSADIDLGEICQEWQKRLRLQDWSVEVRYSQYGEQSDDDGATIRWVDGKKRATILLRPDRLYASGVTPEHHELRIIHELLHLHLWYIEGHTPMQRIAEENAVSFISGALFRLKYQEYQDEYIKD